MITEVHDPYKLILKLHKREREIWEGFFHTAGADGPDRLKAQSFQWRDELAERGKRMSLEDVQDALLELGHEQLGHEDPRRVLYRELAMWATKQDQEARKRLIESLDEEDGFQKAWEAGLSGFRKYLRGQCVASLATRVAV